MKKRLLCLLLLCALLLPSMPALAISVNEAPSEEAKLETVDKARELYRKRIKVDCTGCAYCQPCPKNVDIPGAFAAYNRYHTENRKGAKWEYLRCTLTGMESGLFAYLAHPELCLADYPQYDDACKEMVHSICRKAKELDMPVIIHDRDAHEDTIKILEEYKPKGILHRYSGPVDILKRAFDIGMYISFNNDLTYPMWNAGPIACLMETPWDRLLIETDCPYAPPYERENDRCEAYDVANVVKVIAELRGVSEEFVAQKALENAMRVYEIEL